MQYIFVFFLDIGISTHYRLGMENQTDEAATSTVISLRIPGELFERLEAERARRGRQVNVEVPRTSLIHALMSERLDAIEGSLTAARG